MTYIPITPFGRPVTAAHLEHQSHATATQPPQGVNKWEALRALTTVRKRVGISDRSLNVLQALISFHPDTVLSGDTADLTVFPSNAAICERLHGMPCSTMRRHLAALVDAGLILRRDSPNGKRFARRGQTPQIFGFDLTPLVTRFEALSALAEEVTAEEEAHARLRRAVSLMRRDLAGLAAYGMQTQPDAALWPELQEVAALVAISLRRQLTSAVLEDMEAALLKALDTARDAIDAPTTPVLSTSDPQNEQHHQNSQKDTYESERGIEKGRDDNAVVHLRPTQDTSDLEQDVNLPNAPLALVLESCTSLRDYVPGNIRHWHQLVQAAEVIYPMMGISQAGWQDAIDAMGPEEASVVVAAMLERFDAIKSPGGYLRRLSAKARVGDFSCGPMVLALSRRHAA